jgi:hypothetical protein
MPITFIKRRLSPGTPGSQVVLEQDGVEYRDTYWTDLVTPLTTTRRGSNSRPDFDETNVGYLFPQNDATEILYFIVQLPHSYKEGTSIYPHVHWRQAADQTPVFKLAYKWYNNGAAPPAEFSIYEMSTKVFTYASGTLGQISKGAAPIAGTGKTISSMILCKLYREDNAYTGDVLTDQFDIHYELDQPGSDDEYEK